MDQIANAGDVGNFIIKATNVVILGKQGTGKTTIFKQFQGYFPSRNPDGRMDTNRLEIRSDKVRTVVSDINLPDTLTNICMFSISKGDAFILVYDIGDKQSFAYAEQIKDFLVRIKGKDCPIIFVGNKSDMTQRFMRYEVLDCLVSVDWGFKHLEISAVIDDTVPTILDSVFAMRKPSLPSNDNPDTHVLGSIKRRGITKARSCTYKRKSLIDSELMTSLVARGIIPEPIKQRKVKKRLSLQKSLLNLLQKL